MMMLNTILKQCFDINAIDMLKSIVSKTKIYTVNNMFDSIYFLEIVILEC